MISSMKNSSITQSMTMNEVSPAWLMVSAGQRKIIYTVLNRPLKAKEMKVEELSGKVSSETGYHHSTDSLNDTIIGLAQNFPGSNNINLLIPNGQFGTRLGKEDKGIGQDAAAPRYIYTNIMAMTRLLFNKQDNPLYHYVDDDGKIVEPRYFVPILPLVLINGARGIGTGWSTDVPLYNPQDIIENIDHYLHGQPMNEMTPWYRGFRGTITKISHQKYHVTGIYWRTGPTSIEVDELPVGSARESMSYTAYNEFIISLIIDDSVTDEKIRSKQILRDAEFLPGDKVSRFTLHFQTEKQLNDLLTDLPKFEKLFKLSHNLTTSNMNLFNAEGIMTKYVNPEDILNRIL